MAFASPAYGWLILPLALLMLLTWPRHDRDSFALKRIAEPSLLRRLLPAEGFWQRMPRWLLPMLAILFLVLALMRPQAGMQEVDEEAAGLDIVVALDVSKSMLADDLQPSRLAVAVNAVKQLSAQLRGDRLGLIAFAGSAFQVCPLTGDDALVRQMLDELGPDTLPRGGSSLASALSEAMRAFRGAPPGSRVLVVISDGEDHAGGIDASLQQLRGQGVAVFAAQVGTVAGGLLALPDGRFVKDRQGHVVRSRAVPETLMRLDPAPAAIATDGSGLAPLLARARGTAIETARTERRLRMAEFYQIPLALSLLCWSAELMMRRGRRAP